MDWAAGEGGWCGGLHPQSSQSGNHSHQERSPGEESCEGLSQVCTARFSLPPPQHSKVTNQNAGPRCSELTYLVILKIIFIGSTHVQTKHYYKVKYRGLCDISDIQLMPFENIHGLVKLHFDQKVLWMWEVILKNCFVDKKPRKCGWISSLRWQTWAEGRNYTFFSHSLCVQECIIMHTYSYRYHQSVWLSE